MTRVPEPLWRLVYEGTDITRDIAGDVVRVTYTDHTHGRSDEIEVTLADPRGRWRGPWYPSKADRVSAWIGTAGALMPAGDFRVDEIESVGSGQEGARLVIRALAAAISDDLRTRKSAGFEETTLRRIAERIAGAHGLEVVGDFAPTRFRRVTQDAESDLKFLKRLAEETGHAFTVRGDTLVFFRREALREGAAVATLAPRDLLDWRLRDKGREVYRAAEVSYLDPETKALTRETVENPDVKTGDTIKRYVRVEIRAQALEKARALLEARNTGEVAGTLKVPGAPRLVAGAKLALEGMGALSGDYLVARSTHTLERARGYTTEVEIERV